MIQYNYCSQCGRKVDAGSDPPHCSSCNVTFFRNGKPCASVLPIKDGKVLLAKRGVEPFKGAYDIIGGYVDPDELPEDAAVREAKEEANLDIKLTSLLGMYVDRYGEDGDYTLNMHYIGEVVSGEMKAMDDVAALEWIPIDEVPLNEGFQNTRDGLRDLKKWFHDQTNKTEQ